MDESSAGSVEDLYGGLCPLMKTDKNDTDCLPSQAQTGYSLPATDMRSHRVNQCENQRNQENDETSDQDEDHEDEDALIIDAQVRTTYSRV